MYLFYFELKVALNKHTEIPVLCDSGGFIPVGYRKEHQSLAAYQTCMCHNMHFPPFIVFSYFSLMWDWR